MKVNNPNKPVVYIRKGDYDYHYIKLHPNRFVIGIPQNNGSYLHFEETPHPEYRFDDVIKYFKGLGYYFNNKGTDQYLIDIDKVQIKSESK